MLKYLVLAASLVFVSPVMAKTSMNIHGDQAVVEKSVKSDHIVEARRRTTVRSHSRKGYYTKKGTYRRATKVRRHRRR